jgi:hypothetical protein
MDNRDKDIILNAIKYLDIPIFYKDLQNTYVFEIDIIRGSHRSSDLKSAIESIYGASLNDMESSMVNNIVGCNISPTKKPQAMPITSRMTWLDDGSVNGESTIGELVINPEAALVHLQRGDLSAKEISRIRINTVKTIL